MSKNIFQIWKEIGGKIPFAVRRDNWSNEYYTVVEKIEIRKFPYGNAYGYPTIKGNYSNHYEYSSDWKNNKLIPCAGCYQWTFVSEAKLPEMNNEKISKQNKTNKRLNKYFRTSLFDFGKYKGKTLENVFRENPNYIFWCIKNIPSFYLDLPKINELAQDFALVIPRDIIEAIDGKKKFFTE